MATASVRKFALSVDPDEIVDFAEKLDYFAPIFKDLGFEPVGTYTFRYSDDECMIKAELQSSKDGYFVYLYVQAFDEHSFRLQEIADAFAANVIDRSTIERGGSERIERGGSERFMRGSERIERPGTGRFGAGPGTGRHSR
jgi:hypothetical protein